MKPGKETENLKLDSGYRSRIRRFLSGMAFFLAAIGIIVGVVYTAQREVPMGGIPPESLPFYSYWSVFKFSGPLAMLSFLLMLGCLARVSFRRNAVRTGGLDCACLLPLILGGGIAFQLLTEAWQAVTTGGLDSDIGARYAILESKLQIMVGAVSSLLCFFIARLRLRFAQPKNL